MVAHSVTALAFLASFVCVSTRAFGAGGTTTVPEVLVPSSSVTRAGATIVAEPTLADHREGEGFENGIPLDTKITFSNWQQFDKFMPDGMVELFRGDQFMKMPADVEIDVGPTRVFPLPKGFAEATRKYSGQSKGIVLTNGHYQLGNYVAGSPFPQPSEPDKGWKILADLWYGPLPRISAGTPDTGLSTMCTQDHFGNYQCLKVSYVYRMLSHVYTPGYPVTEPTASGAWYTEWTMVESPEKFKYTAALTIFWQDDQKPEDDYTFLVNLHRTLRLSTGARCAPMFGTDYARDDAHLGFNGGTARFQAKWLHDQKIIALTQMNTAEGTYPDNYDMPLGFAKPSWGQWEVRDAYVIDVRRIPSEAAGYCYGKRIMYVDKALQHEVWSDLYDPDMHLWKIMQFAFAPKLMNGGESSEIGSVWSAIWDFQKRHATIAFTADGPGRDMLVDEQVPKQYENIERYSTPGGLTAVMR